MDLGIAGPPGLPAAIQTRLEQAFGAEQPVVQQMGLKSEFLNAVLG